MGWGKDQAVRKGARRRQRPSGQTVFISHSARDEWIAGQIASQLEGLGARTFLYEIDVESGEDFENRLVKALRGCTELVVLITPSSVDRYYVWMEVGAAMALGKRVTPILYPWTFDELVNQKKDIPVLIRRTRARNINDMPLFLKEFGKRSP